MVSLFNRKIASKLFWPQLVILKRMFISWFKCNSFSNKRRIISCRNVAFFKTDSKSIDETTTYIPNGRMEVTTTQIPKKDITPVIIIFIGSFICLVLMFEIRREIKLYMEVIWFRRPAVLGEVHTNIDDVDNSIWWISLISIMRYL